MTNLNIQNFLKAGQLFDLNATETEESTIARLGKADEIEDYGDNGKFYHYDNARLQFLEGKLIGISMFFMNYDTAFEVNVDDEIFIIQKNMLLTRLIHLLNKLGLSWQIPYEQSRLDYLMLEVESGIKVYFYLENNRLERITKSMNL